MAENNTMIATLKDKNDNFVYPITSTKSVIDSSGITVDKKLSEVAYVADTVREVQSVEKTWNEIYRLQEGTSGSTTANQYGSRWDQYRYNEQQRQAEFDAKQDAIDEATSAVTNCADRLTSLEQKVEELITKVNRIEGTIAQ